MILNSKTNEHKDKIIKLMKDKPDYNCGFGKRVSESLFANNNVAIQFHCPLYSLTACLGNVETSQKYTQIVFVSTCSESDRSSKLISFLREICDKLDITL